MALINCPECGGQVSTHAPACPHCGFNPTALTQRAPAVPVPTGKSNVAAGVLALFLGGFGLHKFYLGRPGLGLLYLLFCWTLIPSIVGFVEGLVYLFSDPAEFASRHP
jgi:TM2 domain-containing membrane protein YozV